MALFTNNIRISTLLLITIQTALSANFYMVDHIIRSTDFPGLSKSAKHITKTTYSNDQIISKDIYEFNQQSKITHHTSIQTGNIIVVTSDPVTLPDTNYYTYSYDNKGHLSKYTATSNKSHPKTSTYSFSYKNNKLIKVSFSRMDSIHELIIYKYDKDNLICSQYHRNNKLLNQDSIFYSKNGDTLKILKGSRTNQYRYNKDRSYTITSTYSDTSHAFESGELPSIICPTTIESKEPWNKYKVTKIVSSYSKDGILVSNVSYNPDDTPRRVRRYFYCNNSKHTEEYMYDNNQLVCYYKENITQYDSLGNTIFVKDWDKHSYSEKHIKYTFDGNLNWIVMQNYSADGKPTSKTVRIIEYF